MEFGNANVFDFDHNIEYFDGAFESPTPEDDDGTFATLQHATRKAHGNESSQFSESFENMSSQS